MEAALAARCDEVCGEVTEHIDAFVAAWEQRKGELVAQCRAVAGEKGGGAAVGRRRAAGGAAAGGGDGRGVSAAAPA